MTTDADFSPQAIDAKMKRFANGADAEAGSMPIRLVDRRRDRCDHSAHGPVQGRIRAVPSASAQYLHASAQVPNVRQNRVVNQWPRGNAAIQCRAGSCLHGGRRRNSGHRHDLCSLFLLLPVRLASHPESGYQWLMTLSLLGRRKGRSSTKGSPYLHTWRSAT